MRNFLLLFLISSSAFATDITARCSSTYNAMAMIAITENMSRILVSYNNIDVIDANNAQVTGDAKRLIITAADEHGSIFLGFPRLILTSAYTEQPVYVTGQITTASGERANVPFRCRMRFDGKYARSL